MMPYDTRQDYFLSKKNKTTTRSEGRNCVFPLVSLFSFSLCSSSTETSKKDKCALPFRLGTVCVCVCVTCSDRVSVPMLRFFPVQILCKCRLIDSLAIFLSLIMSELVWLALCASAALAVMTDGEMGLGSQHSHPPAAYYSCNRLEYCSPRRSTG